MTREIQVYRGVVLVTCDDATIEARRADASADFRAVFSPTRIAATQKSESSALEELAAELSAIENSIRNAARKARREGR